LSICFAIDNLLMVSFLSFFNYSDPQNRNDCAEYEIAFSDCINRMIVDDLPCKVKILQDMCLYKNKEGAFGSDAALVMTTNTHPLQWWEIFGASTVELRNLATRILSLCCSASSCERNWSTFAHVSFLS